ncbi:hypothetical protein BsWGS_04419 [Bradybaena similaris]
MKVQQEMIAFVMLSLAVSSNDGARFSRLRSPPRRKPQSIMTYHRQTQSPFYVYTHATRNREKKMNLPRLASAPGSLTAAVDQTRTAGSTDQFRLASRSVFEDDRHSFKVSLSAMDVIKMCQGKRGSLLAHPDSCSWYVNCSMTPDAVMSRYFDGYVMECPYPQLFSSVTSQCEDFNHVDCQSRFEPKSPCEYRANKCRESSHCIPCWVRYASCRGLSEGLNPWKGMEWQPFFVECHKERTVFQGQCQSSAVFSPITRACETPMSIPSEHGGWKPGCLGRRDGLYPDELGRCDLYFLCQGQLFRGFHSCKSGLKFNPATSSCDKAANIPFPCGDKTESTGICENKDDGNYLDVYGRCNHYFTCRNQSMAGLHVCSAGVFNVFTGRCDNKARVRSYIARPCGEAENECLNKQDGQYAAQRTDSRVKCHKSVVCERELVIASRITCRTATLHASNGTSH